MEPKQWHRDAARAVANRSAGICVLSGDDDTAEGLDDLAQLIASHDPATADPKVIEKYVEIFLALTAGRNEAQIQGNLTRFADEIGGVDVERVWERLVDRHGGGSVCKSITINDLAKALGAKEGE